MQTMIFRSTFIPEKRAKRGFWPVIFISKPVVVFCITYQIRKAMMAAAIIAVERLEPGIRPLNQCRTSRLEVAATMFLLAFFHGPFARY